MLPACGHKHRGAGAPRGGCMRVSAKSNTLKISPAASRPPPLARRAKGVERPQGHRCPPTFVAPAAGAATAAGTRRGRHIGRRTYYSANTTTGGAQAAAAEGAALAAGHNAAEAQGMSGARGGRGGGVSRRRGAPTRAARARWAHLCPRQRVLSAAAAALRRAPSLRGARNGGIPKAPQGARALKRPTTHARRASAERDASSEADFAAFDSGALTAGARALVR